MYDLDKPFAPANELAFYRELARRTPGPILEPMCGSGRFLIPLLQQGFDIDGTDASPHMLEACRTKCSALGLAPNLTECWLHEMKLPRKYGMAFISSGSFGLISDLDVARECLLRLFDCLLPGGSLVLEVERLTAFHPGSYPWGGKWTHRPNGDVIVLSWLGEIDREGVNRGLHRYELFESGRLTSTEIEEWNLRSYSPQQIEQLLIEAGFGDVKFWRCHEFVELGKDDSSMIVECRKL